MTWLAVRNFILTQLKTAAIKAAFLTFFKSAPLGGFRGWLVKTIVNHFADEIADPIIKGIFYNIGYSYEKLEGKILIKKLHEAKNENDQAKYDSTIDVIFDN